MATEAETKAAADKAAKKKRDENLEAAQAEENARNAAGALGGVKPEPVFPMAAAARVAMPRDRQIETTAYNTHVIKVPANVSVEEALSAKYLYSIAPKLKRYDKVVLHNEAWAWEYEGRVMKIDTELQEVRHSKISFAEHDLVAANQASMGDVSVQHLGDALKWTVLRGKQRLKSGFDSKVEAEQWVGTYRGGVVGKAA
jgi:hypothetical protein